MFIYLVFYFNWTVGFKGVILFVIFYFIIAVFDFAGTNMKLSEITNNCIVLLQLLIVNHSNACSSWNQNENRLRVMNTGLFTEIINPFYLFQKFRKRGMYNFSSENSTNICEQISNIIEDVAKRSFNSLIILNYENNPSWEARGLSSNWSAKCKVNSDQQNYYYDFFLTGRDVTLQLKTSCFFPW